MRIRVSCDSNANCQSRNEDDVELADLGIESEEEWNELSDEEKCQTVVDYWHSQGVPEISFEEVHE